MWFVKGILAGSGVFVIWLIVYLFAKLRPIEATKATSVNLLLSLTASNIWFWIVLLLCLGVCCYVFRLDAANNEAIQKMQNVK
jgi:hypothetical protein